MPVYEQQHVCILSQTVRLTSCKELTNCSLIQLQRSYKLFACPVTKDLQTVRWSSRLQRTGFVRAPGNPGKPWKIFEALEIPGNAGKAPGIFFIKPWKISQNFIEKINSSNVTFSGLNNKHLKSLAIRASDCSRFTGPEFKEYWPGQKSKEANSNSDGFVSTGILPY